MLCALVMDSERALRIATTPFGMGRGTGAREAASSVPDLESIDDAWASSLGSAASGGPEALRSTRAEPLAAQARAAATRAPAIVLLPSPKAAADTRPAVKSAPGKISSLAGVPSLYELVEARRDWEAERERLRQESEPPPSGVVTKSSRPAPDILAVPQTPSAFPLADLPTAPRDHRDARLTFGMGMLCGALLVALALVAVVFSR